MKSTHEPNYLPHIDGLRAFAVIAVVVYHLHAAWLPGGFTGVDVFFVISGYVVTASLASRANESVGKFIGGFYARRLIRVAPALIVMLLVTAYACVLFVPPGWLNGLTERTALYAFFGLSNVLLARNTEAYFAPRTEFNAFTHTWSLGVEEQFYLVVPLLLFGWFRWRSRDAHRALIVAAVIGSLAIASILFLRWAQANSPLHAFYSLAARFWELAIGAMLFQWSHWRAQRPARRLMPAALSLPTTNVAPLCGLALLIFANVFTPIAQFPWPYALCAVLASTLLIGASGPQPPRDFVRRWLGSTALVWIGLRSYSLYLWHWPVFVLMRWTIGTHNVALQCLAIALTFALAEISYRFIETPIRRSAWLRARPIWLQIVIMLLAIGGSAWFAQSLIGWRAQLTLSSVARDSRDWYATDRMFGLENSRQCDVDIRYRQAEGTAVVEYYARDCKRSPVSAQMFVLGDSHATAYQMMFDQFAAETGVTVRVYHTPGCPFIELNAPLLEGRGEGCVSLARAAQRDTLSLATPGDIVFLASLRLPRLSDQWMRFDEAIAWALMTGDAAKLARDRAIADATQWFGPFTDKGMRVVFELPKPLFKSPPFRCSDWFNRNNDVCSGGLTMARETMERYRQPVVAATQRIAQSDRGVTVWDPFPSLCPDQVCSAFRDNVPLYHDGDHLSGAGNRAAYPSFRAAMCQRLPSESCTH